MKKDIIIPEAGESVTEADIVSWYKHNGDFVVMDDPIVELETDKASMDLTAEISGILSISIQSGTVKVGQVIGSIEESKDAPPTKPISTTTAPVSEQQAEPKVDPIKSDIPTSDSYAKGHPSPAAEKLLAEKGLSKTAIQGSGKDGRITKHDVAATTPSTPSAPPKSPPSTVPTPASLSPRSSERKPLSRLRKTLMNRLIEAQQTTASLTTFNEIDMANVITMRKKYKDAFKEKYNTGLGFMSFFTKAVTIALDAWPIINASIDGDDVVYNNYCDIGIAVSTPKGLVVPVVRNAETLSFADIEAQIRQYATKGQDGKLTIDDMSGGTFTITNGGTFGSMLSTPILNRPQSAILGMHNIVERPVAINGEVVVHPVMYVALTYDHRLIDGREAVQFLVMLKHLLEDPARLLLGL
ncbi:dihydrolipoyllysine-residue succinyltransferase [bacterium]|nr:dihydrolipoyllysine-residue succinyltransferase [bacterium]|tara:strand:- start:681 stop:1916 length:1236 start_codon:yes stop_codon:yes gene_type:complete